LVVSKIDQNCRVDYAPGIGMRIHGLNFVKTQFNIIHHNSRRRNCIRKNGFMMQFILNTPKGLDKDDPFDGYRIQILGNQVFENYNGVYS
jgi:hypothetical protein